MVPVYNDQLEMYEALKQIKVRMQNTYVLFGGETMTIWKVADIADSLENPDDTEELDPNAVL